MQKTGQTESKQPPKLLLTRNALFPRRRALLFTRLKKSKLVMLSPCMTGILRTSNRRFINLPSLNGGGLKTSWSSPLGRIYGVRSRVTAMGEYRDESISPKNYALNAPSVMKPLPNSLGNYLSPPIPRVSRPLLHL